MRPLVADLVDPDTVYVLNVALYKSVDGGRTFAVLQDSHEDHHDLWLNPTNPRILINANDGGATEVLARLWRFDMGEPHAGAWPS